MTLPKAFSGLSQQAAAKVQLNKWQPGSTLGSESRARGMNSGQFKENANCTGLTFSMDLLLSITSSEVLLNVYFWNHYVASRSSFLAFNQIMRATHCLINKS